MRFDDKVYDVLKWVCLIALPAISVLYAAVDSVFSLGYTDKVATIISAVAAFIGALIGISTKSYNCEVEKDEHC